MQAGELEAVESATWPLADRRTNVALDMKEPADILLMGRPRNFHYGPGMGTNPILMSLAIGGQLSRCWHVFRPGGCHYRRFDLRRLVQPSLVSFL